MSDARLPDPERLVCDPELGPLLEQANAEYRARLDEASAFRKLSERLARSGRGGPRFAAWPTFGVLAAGLAIALGVGLGFERSSSDTTRITLGPEAPRGALGGRRERRDERDGERGTKGALKPGPTEMVEPVGAVARAPAKEQGLEKGAPDDQVRALGGPARRAKARAAPLTAEPAAPRDEPREGCLALARQGDARAAERCFGERAAGSGLSAEMALYEVARLRRDVLRDVAGALVALGEYRERFPRGSLRNEVDLSRVELLAELGRNAQALEESAALLASATGRERAAELHVLRGNVYRRGVGDLRAAADEYARAEALGGPRGVEASRLRGACLEALGDIAGALAAYRRYAAAPDQPRAAEVSRHIERLNASSNERGSLP